MNMKLMMVAVVTVAATFQVCVARGEKSVQGIYDDLSRATSNAWGNSKIAFDLVARSNMSELASIDTAESRELRAQWLMNLSRMNVPTNDPQYPVWLKAKVVWLAGSGRYFADPGFTNLWFAAADVLGCLRQCSRDDGDVIAGCRSTDTNGVLAVGSGCPEDLMNALAALGAQRDSAAMLSRLILESYGRRGLKRLEENARPAVVSNLVLRARLSETEQDKLLDYAE